jgi:hypothetical protein
MVTKIEILPSGKAGLNLPKLNEKSALQTNSWHRFHLSARLNIYWIDYFVESKKWVKSPNYVFDFLMLLALYETDLIELGSCLLRMRIRFLTLCNLNLTFISCRFSRFLGKTQDVILFVCEPRHWFQLLVTEPGKLTCYWTTIIEHVDSTYEFFFLGDLFTLLLPFYYPHGQLLGVGFLSCWVETNLVTCLTSI